MVGVIALLVVLLALGTDIQSVDEYYLTHMEDITEDSETVTLRISGAIRFLITGISWISSFAAANTSRPMG